VGAPAGLKPKILLHAIMKIFWIFVEQRKIEEAGPAGQLAENSSLYSITERRVPELIPVFGSQPAGDVSHKTGGRLPLLFARPAKN